MQQMKRTKAVLMSRVSSDEQISGYSLDVQEENLKKYCDRESIEIVYTFREDHSAKDFNRPRFKEFLNYLKRNSGCVDLLLFTTWDRFSRNLTDSLNMFRTLDKFGVLPQAIAQPIDHSIPETKAMLALYLSLPEIDNTRRSMKIREGIRASLKAGRWARGAPFGYKNERDEFNKPIIVPDNNAQYVQFAFESVLKGVSQAEIIQILLKRGVKINKTSLSDLLRNPLYMGKIPVPKSGDEPATFVESLHAPIISEELFYQVQQIFKGKRLLSSSFNKQKDELYLRGILLCGKCHSHLTGSASRSKNGKRHYYYHCNHCKKLRYPAYEVNVQMELFFQRLKFDDRIDKIYKSVVKNKIARSKPILRIRNENQERIQYLEKRIENIQDMLADKSIIYSEYVEMKTRYGRELEALNNKNSELTIAKNQSDLRLHKVYTILSNLKQLFLDADHHEKRKIISSIFPEKILFDGNESRTPRINSVFKRFVVINKQLEKKKSGQLKDYFNLSALVV